MTAATEVIIEPAPEGKGAVQPLATHPLAIIDRAIQSGTDAENLRMLMEIQIDWEKRRAAEVFGSALAGFQAECPMVFKRRPVLNKDRSIRYHFASYDDIRRVTRPLEAKYNLSTSFNIEQTEDGKLRATCRVRVGSHYEDHTFMVPIPKGMGTNDAQDYGAALSYVKRYCYCAALNIVVSDEDEDAANLGEKINADQLDQIREQIGTKGIQEAAFLNWVSATAKVAVSRLADIPASMFDVVIDTLRRRPVNGSSASAGKGGRR